MLVNALLTALLIGSRVHATTQHIPSRSLYTPLPHSDSIVDVGYAIYKGLFNETSNITSFLGVRYAAPPIGQLRFQAPAPPLDERPLGVQNADTLPTGCLQASVGQNKSTPFRANSTNLSKRSSNPEDCLFLNVWVPGKVDPYAKLPVLVYIHGGGYEFGDVTNTTGDDLIREGGGGLVTVTLDYRLGIFGFLAGEEVKQKGALNAGLLDQQAVLQWVQQNIHLFGGNPDEVTIWGESAGAGSVLQHLMAHGGNTQPPLFKGAMTSSTFLPSQYKYNDRIPEHIYTEVLQMAGCANASDTFECLVGTDQIILQRANMQSSMLSFAGTFVSVPVIDGDFIQRSPTEQISSGKLNGERLLSFTNTFEGNIFVSPAFSANMTMQYYVSQLFPNFNQSQSNAAAALYTNISTLVTNFDKMAAIMGESIFICPTYLLLQSFNGTTHKGEFAIPDGLHASDIAYYFPHPTPPPYNNTQFLSSFAGAFTAFAKSGDPNVHPVPGVITRQWGQFNGSHNEMLFNRTADLKPDIRTVTTDPALLKRCDFWKTMSVAAGQ